MNMMPDELAGLRPLLDGLSDGVCIADAGGKLIYANAAAGRLLGLSPEQAESATICSLLCERLDGPGGAACALRRPGPEDSITFEGVYGGASVEGGKDLRVRCLRARRPHGERHFLIIEDASERAEAERRQEDWRSMFAHDLRSPLTNVLGVLRDIQDKGVGHCVSSRDVEMIRLAARSCGRVTDLLEAYLTVARMKAGSMPVHVAVFELGAFVRECAVEEAVKALERGRALECDAPDGLWARADPELLRRALTNLVDNALKFTMSGGRVRVSARADGPWAEIRVEDDGPGIAAGDLPHVFERFFQARDVSRGTGFGLGLTFCREALRAMGGEAAAESEPGRGSVFTLRVPAAPPPGRDGP